MKKIVMLLALTASALPLVANASKVESFTCGGTKVKISFVDNDRAVLIYPDDVIVLDSASSASGARYVGQGTQLWEAKGQINIATLTSEEESSGKVARDTGVNCKKAR